MGLELSDAAGGVVADGVIGEAEDVSPGATEIVLAEPVVAEGITVRMELEAVELHRERALGSSDLVVDPVVVSVHLDAGLGLNVAGETGPDCRCEHPAQECVLEERIGAELFVERHVTRPASRRRWPRCE